MRTRECKIKTRCGPTLQYRPKLKPAGRSWLIHKNKHFPHSHQLHRPASYYKLSCTQQPHVHSDTAHTELHRIKRNKGEVEMSPSGDAACAEDMCLKPVCSVRFTTIQPEISPPEFGHSGTIMSGPLKVN